MDTLLCPLARRWREISTCTPCTLCMSAHVRTCLPRFSRCGLTALPLTRPLSQAPSCTQSKSTLNYMTSPWGLWIYHRVLGWIDPTCFPVDRVWRLPHGCSYFNHIMDEEIVCANQSKDEKHLVPLPHMLVQIPSLSFRYSLPFVTPCFLYWDTKLKRWIDMKDKTEMKRRENNENYTLNCL